MSATTVVGGRVLMRDRQVRTLKPEEVLRDARAMAERVRVSVPPPTGGGGERQIAWRQKFCSLDREIEARIAELARTIRADFGNGTPIHFVGVLKGAFVFLADSDSRGRRTRDVRLHRRVELWVRHLLVRRSAADERSGSKASKGATSSSSRTSWTRASRCRIFRRSCARASPRSLKTACLLSKPSRRKIDVKVEYIGFTIEDRFVVGYGLDFDEQHRNLPDIVVLEGN